MKIERINHNKLLKSASYFSVFIASLILAMKTYAWLTTNSASIFASLIDSALDITSSIITMIAIRFSMMPPDDNHRFGHEKIQDLAVFGQAIFFLASSIFVIFSSINHFQHHIIITNTIVAIYIMIASIIGTIFLLIYQTYVISITNSNAIKADKIHYATDLLANLTVIISIYTSSKYWFLDSVFGVLIGIYLFIGAYKILKTALVNLLDEEFDKKDKAKIFAIIEKHKKLGNILSMHDLKTRKAANKYFIQFHLVMNGEKSLRDVHIITETIEEEVLEQFADSEIIIHQDPDDSDEYIRYKEEE